MASPLILQSRGLFARAAAVCLVLAMVAMAAVPQRVFAGGSSKGYTTAAKSAILVDADTGAILYQHNADELYPPASMSKLMTLAVLFKAIRDGRVKLEDEFLMSEHAWRTGGAPSGTSAMFVPLNTKVTVHQLIQGMIVQSGNDAAISVAENMAGTEQSFAKFMTAEARRLGLEKSTFKNPTGLYDAEQLMTARELAQLSLYLIKEYPEFYKIFSQTRFKYRKHNFINRNPLLFAKIGVDGLKTGYVKEAGYCMAASAKRDGKRLIAVIMGLPSKKARKSEMTRLLNWGFRSFAAFKLFDVNETVAYARVWGGESLYVPLVAKGELSVILPRIPENPNLSAQVVYDGPLKPPVKQGDKIAVLRVTSETNAVNEVPLYAAEDVQPGGLVRRGLDSLAHLAVSWVPL
jgi:serine-type D-Ala-D-Ala carboxypeptidase (penicillin-binding protein 5/6)